MTFEIEGINFARRALTTLANQPISNPKSDIRRQLVKELYTEIRAVRIAGHSWRSIQEGITGHIKIAISGQTLKTLFAELDNAYAKETGVAAIQPLVTRKKTSRQKKNREAERKN